MNSDRPSAKGTRKDLQNEQRDMRGDARVGGPDGPLGAHPVGTAVGAVAGAVATGAAIGSVAGPIGAAVGAGIGAAAGGLAGKGIADMVDPLAENEFWRTNWQTRPYIDQGFTYDKDYGPAYRHGVDAYMRYPERHFDEIETDLSEGWRSARGESRLEWEHARPAARDAWERVKDRVERAMPGDADGDGR
ncbi:MAG: hypothetical protein AB1430_24430 [Pseudomonadota bacterium]